MKRLALLLALLSAPPVLAAQGPERSFAEIPGKSDIVFICEHGSAKSVVAAAHFNRLAALRRLPFRAVARGTRPDEAMAPAALAGLRQDQLEPADARPVRLAPSDLEGARQVIAFSELPDEFEHAGVEIWTVPPVSGDYAAARDAIVQRLQDLLDELAAGPK